MSAQNSTAAAAPGSAPDLTKPSDAPADRSTTFQPVLGPTQHYSGEGLLVTGYAILWVILLAWVGLVWRKQRALDARILDLEREIDKAAGPGGGPPG